MGSDNWATHAARALAIAESLHPSDTLPAEPEWMGSPVHVEDDALRWIRFGIGSSDLRPPQKPVATRSSESRAHSMSPE
jgi:hypothetical protein